MRALRRPSGAYWRARLVVTVLSLSLVAGAGLALHATQSSAHRAVAQRWQAKATLSARFAATYIGQLTGREQLVAARTLTGAHPGRAFTDDVQGFGFGAAFLLDSHGRALAISPPDPALMGKQLDKKYTHLTAVLKSRVAVSNLVPSAANATPMVAFAVPFQTPHGRRVFSGGHPINDTPLTAYLTDATAVQGARLYLTDNTGAILATNGQPIEGVETLSQRAPALGVAAATADGGSYRAGATSYTFAKSRVPGTTWTLVITGPTPVVFATTGGTALWLPWLILGCLSLLIAVAASLAIRLLEGRRRLADANRQLEMLARTDELTGLSNRRHLTEQLETLLANSARHGFPLCVLMIDVDHFKSLNDTHGHNVGDQALVYIATRLAASQREGDLLARWGGDEFLVILPYSNLEAGLTVAERLCAAIAADPIELGASGTLVTLQVSIGVAQTGDDGLDALVHRADLALYDAKAAGRNTARASSVSLAAPATPIALGQGATTA